MAVVVITHQRREELLLAVARLLALPERPLVVVVDNGSTDGTAAAVRERFPDVELIPSPENLGAVGRNVGVSRLTTPYVAFCDDDTWWEPGSLARAGDLLDGHPRLAAVTGRIVVEPGGTEDPIVAELRNSPVRGAAWLPGPALGSFLAGATVLRREALRRRHGIRNTLWTTWLRRPLRPALRRTLRLLRTVPRDRVTALALLDAARGIPWVARERRVLPPHAEARFAALEQAQRLSSARRHVS